MGIQIEVTNVQKESNSVSYSQDGQSKTASIVAPAQIKYARIGKAEAGFSQEGNINFLKSLEPKQEKSFKSVLKLDKNFHIYIHGDRQLIEKGTDADGRKFYKVYYDKEK